MLTLQFNELQLCGYGNDCCSLYIEEVIVILCSLGQLVLALCGHSSAVSTRVTASLTFSVHSPTVDFPRAARATYFVLALLNTEYRTLTLHC